MEIKARDIKTIKGDVFSDSLIEEIEKIPEGEMVNFDLTGATPDQVMQAIDYKLPFSTAMKFRDAFKAVGSIAESMHKAEPVLIKKGGGTHETTTE